MKFVCIKGPTQTDWLDLVILKQKNIISSICVHIDGKMITNIIKNISSDHALYVN